MAAEKPLIGITGPRRGSVGPRFCIALALRVSGARPVQLRPGGPDLPEDLAGLVISGGHDVEPVMYKSAAEVEGNYDPERDAFESEVIREALDRTLPLLGICRGAQLLNVCLGGTLFQNLAELHKDTTRRRSIFPVKTVVLQEESRLADWLGRTTLMVNSLHNQSIDQVGSGLVVTARDERDIVQAVEDPERSFLAGVQWHPEFLLYQRANRQLFRALVDAAHAARS